MGTKTNPGDFDCHAKAEPDEPLFTLLARDPDAPILVQFWATWAERRGADPRKVAEARQCAQAMTAWRNRRDELRDTERSVDDLKRAIEASNGEGVTAHLPDGTTMQLTQCLEFDAPPVNETIPPPTYSGVAVEGYGGPAKTFGEPVHVVCQCNIFETCAECRANPR